MSKLLPKSHYETLGVKTDATPNDLKRAYRSKARRSHPDKGGSHESMSEINRAFEVLSDPARKQLYDATGIDQQHRPIDSEARDMVLGAFLDVLTKDAPLILKHAKKLFEIEIDTSKHNRRKIEADIKKFKTRRDKIVLTTKKRKRGDGEGIGNLFHLLIDKQVEAGEAALALVDHRIELCERALEMLMEYKSNEQTERQMMVFLGLGQSTSTTGLG